MQFVRTENILLDCEVKMGGEEKKTPLKEFI